MTSSDAFRINGWVYNSYLKVTAKDGSAGIDKQSIEAFNENMSANLYKIWNRMTSGSYFPPPVRTVFIPKSKVESYLLEYHLFYHWHLGIKA